MSFETQEQLIELVVTVKTASKTGAIELKYGRNSLSFSLATRRLFNWPVHDKDQGRVDFRLYIDRATVEAFLGHGSLYWIGARNDIAAPIGKISVAAVGGAKGTVESMKVYKLKSIWPDDADTLTYSNKK